MDSNQLILGMAGNVPYYPPKEFLSPSVLRRIKRAIIDYRTTKVNDPMGKGAYFLLKGLAQVHKDYDVLLRMWGSVDSRYARDVDKSGLSERVEIGGFVPKEESMQRLKDCDVMVLTLALGANGNPPFSLPGKMFDYFAIVHPKDTAAIARAISELASSPATLRTDYRLQSGFLDRFSHHRMVEQMADILDSLA